MEIIAISPSIDVSIVSSRHITGEYNTITFVWMDAFRMPYVYKQ